MKNRTAVHAHISQELASVFEDICIDEGVTKSALITVLIDEFLERTDIKDTIKKARRIRAGRPREV